MSSARSVLVAVGVSGTIGKGLVKACLESKPGLVVIGVFRNASSMEKTLESLGNPSESDFIPVIGTIDTEEAGTALRKLIESKAPGPVTHVVVSIGSMGYMGPIMNQSLDQFHEDCFPKKLAPHFVAAKTFLPALCDNPSASYTIINGIVAKTVMPNCGNMTVSNGALSKLYAVLVAENRDKKIRLNEIMISCFVIPWDSAEFPPNNVSSLDMGKAILGTLVHPAARSVSMVVTPADLDKLANTGITDTINQ